MYGGGNNCTQIVKKSNFQYRFAKLTVISAYRSICLLSQHTHLCLSDGPVPMLVQYKYC